MRSSPLVNVVREFMAPYRDRLGVVAVSGGADSVALARALHEAGCGPFIIGHLNHGLRGEESDADEAFVRNLARSLGSGCLSARIDAAKEAAGANLEATARRLRYQFLEKTAAGAGAGWIATGHTADDQAETVLHRLIRGTGLQGLRGIARGVPRSADFAPRRIVRPLLSITRSEILDYLVSLDQPYRTDSSNADSRFTRNRIRAELVPLLETFNPRVVPVLGRLAEQAEEAFAYIEEQARQLLKQAEKPRAGEMVILDRQVLTKSSRLLVREAMRLIWEREGWPMGEMDFAQWNHAESLSPHDFPGGVSLHVRERVVQLSSSSKFQVPSSKTDP
jgi:tRNA(Ile)-lysidine synthase